MNSKFNRHQRKKTHVATTNQLRRSNVMDPMLGIGRLSNLHPENRGQGPPLPNAYLQQAGRMNGTINQSTPPPLPPRHDNTSMNRYRYGGNSGMNRYPGMNNYYSPYGGSRYSSGLYSSSMYSPYSSYRMPYGQYGASNDEYSSFLQMAEESTRPAFESIESVVHIFNSISMMLESTYGAVYGSYSAILGVVDQFSRLKDHFAQVFSVLAMLKELHYLCLKVLYLLGLRKSNPSVEKAWQTAHTAAASGTIPPHAKGSVWPFFMFLSLVVGAPWLMFKLLSKNAVKKPFDPHFWKNAEGKLSVGIANYDFVATQPGELSFKAGEKLILHPKDLEEARTIRRSWMLACNSEYETGLVPVNYLHSTPRQRTGVSQQQTLSQGVPSYYNTGLNPGEPSFGTTQPDVSIGVPQYSNISPKTDILIPSNSDNDTGLPTPSSLNNNNTDSKDVSASDSNSPSASSCDANSKSSADLSPNLLPASSLNDTTNSSTLDSLKECPKSK